MVIISYKIDKRRCQKRIKNNMVVTKLYIFFIIKVRIYDNIHDAMNCALYIFYFSKLLIFKCKLDYLYRHSEI